MDPFRSDVRRPARMDVHDEEHRIVLGSVADAVHRVLLKLDVGRWGCAIGAVVPPRRGVVDDVPAGVAAQMHATVEQDHDPGPAVRRIQGGIVEIQLERWVARLQPLEVIRHLVGRRLREELALALDAYDHAGVAGPWNVCRILEEASPHARGPLPLLEVGHLYGPARLRVPPLRRLEPRISNRVPDFAGPLLRTTR